MSSDTYLTIAGNAEATYREKGSKFLAFAYPVSDEDTAKELLNGLRKKYYDATHHCYAWRIGPEAEIERFNDDGEPSGTAGRPIMGQLTSAGITNSMVVVVRYFGGTKLGVGGLVTAYKESAAAVIAECEVVERTVDALVDLEFSYMSMNDVMRVVKDMKPKVVSQDFDNLCKMNLRIRKSKGDELMAKMGDIDGVSAELNGYV